MTSLCLSKPKPLQSTESPRSIIMDEQEGHSLLDSPNREEFNKNEHDVYITTSSTSNYKLRKTLVSALLMVLVVTVFGLVIVIRNDHQTYRIGHTRYVVLQEQHQQLQAKYHNLEQHIHVEQSRYAQLLPEVTTQFYETSPYNNPSDKASEDHYWESINFDPGIIALDDGFAAQMALPIAQRFPWDHRKGIYLVNAYHHLHCLKSIHGSISEYRDGIPQSRQYSHVAHCLDALRREIICNADDTPRVTTRKDSPNSGVGQSRKCRSWDKLEAWALQNSACFSYIDPGNATLSNLDRYRFCPEGSRYVKQSQQITQEMD